MRHGQIFFQIDRLLEEVPRLCEEAVAFRSFRLRIGRDLFYLTSFKKYSGFFGSNSRDRL